MKSLFILISLYQAIIGTNTSDTVLKFQDPQNSEYTYTSVKANMEHIKGLVFVDYCPTKNIIKVTIDKDVIPNNETLMKQIRTMTPYHLKTTDLDFNSFTCD